jgi:hypothetical protein
MRMRAHVWLLDGNPRHRKRGTIHLPILWGQAVLQGEHNGIQSMKAIITKYALSSGCTVAEGETSTSPTGRITFAAQGKIFMNDYYHSGEFHLAKVDAVCQVEKMADKLRKSLEKRLSKIDMFKERAIKQIEKADL